MNIDKDSWNTIVINNNGSPLHAWEWVQSKELAGIKVKWFLLDDDKATVAVPIFIEYKIIGWIPHGIPYKGDIDHIKLKLKSFFLRNGIIGVITSYYNFVKCDELINKFVKINIKNNQETFILNIDSKNDEQLFNKFNSTTKKHIKKTYRLNFHCENFNDNDFVAFWNYYKKFNIERNFKSPTNNKIFNNLVELVTNNDNDYSLKFIAKKGIYEQNQGGYIIVLTMGNRAHEYLRFSTKEYKNLQGGDKALTWEVLKECMNSKCKLYDFGGVKKNSQPGIFNFKRGFGGEHILASDYKVMLTL